MNKKAAGSFVRAANGMSDAWPRGRARGKDVDGKKSN